MQEIKFIVIIMLSCIMSICGFAQNSNEQDLLKEANLGNSEAQYKMGKCLGDKKEYTQAFEWWSKAAAQGFAKAEYNVGVCYENGMGVEKNTVKAFEWYSKAATQGFANAEYSVGAFYYLGIGVERNITKAFEWWSKAAAQGFAKAEYNVGGCYENGMGVEKNTAKAFEWYSKAATQGFSHAEYNVGICYEHGMGVERNWRKARKWMNKAAEDGSLDAQIESINKYLNHKDAGMAMKYILLACKQGDENSKKIFEECTGMPYENLEDTYKGKVKIYMGKYETTYLPGGNCTYQYYEIGNLRIYHGMFEFRSNFTFRTKTGQTIPRLAIKGCFKDGFRDGMWEIRYGRNLVDEFGIEKFGLAGLAGIQKLSELEKSGSLNKLCSIDEIDVTYQNGVFYGPIRYTHKDASNITKKQIKAEYKDGLMVGKYISRIGDVLTEVSMDDNGLLHGRLSYEKKGDTVITGDFIHGETNNCFTKNLQTGSFTRYNGASKLITAPWTETHSIMWRLTKRFRIGAGYIPDYATNDEF